MRTSQDSNNWHERRGTPQEAPKQNDCSYKGYPFQSSKTSRELLQFMTTRISKKGPYNQQLPKGLSRASEKEKDLDRPQHATPPSFKGPKTNRDLITHPTASNHAQLNNTTHPMHQGG